MLRAGQELLLSFETVSIGVGDPPGASLVQAIDFKLTSGEALGIVGESGSGKSLTALSIAGLLPAGLKITSGRIVFDGRAISELSERNLHRLRGKEISYVFQDPLAALNPTLTIGRQMSDVLRRHVGGSRHSIRERAVNALTSVGIPEPAARLRSYPHQLSGGMRQRVLIAMAMLCSPKLLIADEPTTALDVTVQAKIIDLLREIRTTGVSLIFISHNVDLVFEFCDRVLVLYGGRIMEVGTVEEIGIRPQHPYTRALTECVPRLRTQVERLRVIDGQPPTAGNQLPGCPFAARCPRAIARCRAEQPPATYISGTHAFACWNPAVPMMAARAG